MQSKRTSWKSLAFVVVLLLAMALAFGLTRWMAGTLGPSEQALSMLASDDAVRVVQDSRTIAFMPAGARPASGFILYPGARVDFRSYAPVLRDIAARGHLAVVLRAPLNLPLLSPNAADPIIAAYPEVTAWVVGGHSLGGVVAAGFAARRPGVRGLALWASYPSRSLAESKAEVLSLFGSNDRLATPEDVLASRPLLPPDATFYEIAGGNHSQFGSYGLQPGDGAATITPEQQWAEITDTTSDLLESSAAR